MHQLLLSTMTCPVCGKTSVEDTRTNMQIGELPRSQVPYVREGDRFQMRFEQLPYCGFEIVREPAPGEPYHLLVPWHCPFCGTSDQWARVEMQPEGEWTTVKSIRP